MGKGRDEIFPRFFVPVPLVPKAAIPVPIPRDTKSAGTDRDSRPASPDIYKLNYIETKNNGAF